MSDELGPGPTQAQVYGPKIKLNKGPLSPKLMD